MCCARARDFLIYHGAPVQDTVSLLSILNFRVTLYIALASRPSSPNLLPISCTFHNLILVCLRSKTFWNGVSWVCEVATENMKKFRASKIIQKIYVFASWWFLPLPRSINLINLIWVSESHDQLQRLCVWRKFLWKVHENFKCIVWRRRCWEKKKVLFMKEKFY